MRSSLRKVMFLFYLLFALALLPSCSSEYAYNGKQQESGSNEESSQQELVDTTDIAWINYNGYDYYGYVKNGEIVEVDCAVGSRGPAGGYIFYDVDADNDDFDNDGLVSWECGYRYLETAPALLHLVDGKPCVDSSNSKYASGTSSFIQGYYRTSASGSNLRFNSTETYHPWDCTEDDLGTGLENTELIVKRMGLNGENAYTASSGSTTTKLYAALLCYNLEYKAANGVTYSDWFLPSAMELSAAAWNLTDSSLISAKNGKVYQSSSEKSEETFTVSGNTVYGVNYMHDTNCATSTVSGDTNDVLKGVKPASKLRDASLPVLPARRVACEKKDAADSSSSIPANTKTFSVGDVGPAGGYVIYDKGSYSDGWRYLEVSPSNVVIGSDGNPTLRTLAGSYSSSYVPSKYINKAASITNGISANYFVGCYYRKEGFGTNYYVNGTATYLASNCTSQAIGSGLENTELLVDAMWGDDGKLAFTKVSASEIFLSYFPAHVCSELSVTKGGIVYDDWFLPSLQELALVGNLSDEIKGNLLVEDYSCWSSSESTDTAEEMYSFNITSLETTSKARNKRIYVLAVRRF